VSAGTATDHRTTAARTVTEGVPDRDALRDILPVVVSVMPFAAVIGVTIAQATGVPHWGGLLAGPLMYAGSAHLVALTLLERGGGVAAVLGAVVVINARFAMYGAGLEPRFRTQPAWFRWLAPHFLVDQTYAIATARTDLTDPVRFRRYWLTAGLVLGTGWVGTMAAAMLLGPSLGPDSPLAFAPTAVFVGLLAPRLRARAARRPAVIGAVVAIVAAPLPHGLGLLAGAVAGVLPTMLAADGAGS
jgi:predicted branched-subunit amino acid permease